MPERPGTRPLRRFFPGPDDPTVLTAGTYYLRP